MNDYREFLERKRLRSPAAGIRVPEEALHPSLFGFQKRITAWALRRGKAAVFAHTGLGKALASDTPVMTPGGTVRIDTLRPGDKVIGANGKPIRVVGVFPQGVRPAFRVTFSDDASVICDDEHLWAVRSKVQKHTGRGFHTQTLREIRERGLGGPGPDRYNRWFIPMVQPVEFQEGELPLHPYVLGCLIGDGYIKYGIPAISSADIELIEQMNEHLPIGYEAQKRRYTRYDWSISRTGRRAGKQGGHLKNEVVEALEELRLWGHGAESKFIPECYKFARVDTRIWLLQGLLDTDGGVWDSHGSSVLEFCTVSQTLAEDFLFLVRSVGGRGRIRIKKTNGRLAYRIHPSFPPGIAPFLLGRKASVFHERTKYPPHRSISKVEEVEPCEMTCIAVDAPDGLFVIKDFIVTHNTRIQLDWARHVLRHTERPVLILAPLAVTHQTAREAERMDLGVSVVRRQADVGEGIHVTNYEMLHEFDPATFSGVVADEGSILKAYDGTMRRRITEFASQIPFRLDATATPAPNDLTELGCHAEFLGVMSIKEMAALFFRQRGENVHQWSLKGHAKKPFYEWLASWSIACRMPSDLGFPDDGFELPPLTMHQHTVESEEAPAGQLFPVEAVTLDEVRASMRATLSERVAVCAEMVNASDEPWIVWCNLNAESEALARAIPDAVEVRGSDSVDEKELRLMAFVDGEARVLVSKPTICGFGMNFQHCARVAFVGLSYSWEQYFQAIRRCWRFGQTRPVECHVISANTEGRVVAAIERKEQQAEEMMSEIMREMRDYQADASEKQEVGYVEDVAQGEDWKLYLGDCVERMAEIETESVGLALCSPPFPSMYAYTNSARDMGNVRSIGEMIEQFRFLVDGERLLRVMMPGRVFAVHLQQAMAFKHTEGYTGLKDFRGAVIATMEDAGWHYIGEACIEKNPQSKAARTKDRGLLFKTLATDSSLMTMAQADYLIYFRKPGDNPNPVRAGISSRYGNPDGWITNEEWIEWASPVWYRKSLEHPRGIRETDVLNVAVARDAEDERHLCPLQLGVCERAIKLWTAPGELVLDPFAGIGSVGVTALKFNRRFVGCELKQSYFRTACRYLTEAERHREQPSLFGMSEELEEVAG